MQTALRRSLPDDKWLRLKEAALTRFGQLKTDNERTTLYNALTRYEKRADGDFTDRQTATTDAKKPLRAIFVLKNHTLGIVRSVKRFLLARIVKDLFGSEPFFYVKPEGRADKTLSLRMQKHAGWKLRLARYREKIKRAIEQVLDVGFCPVKTTWDVQEDLSERLEMILVWKSDGKPVLTRDGDYIYLEDEMVEAGPEVRGQRSEVSEGVATPARPEDGGPSLRNAQDDRSGEDEVAAGPEPALDAEFSGLNPENPAARRRMAFAKAPEVVMDDAKYTWAEHLIEERVRIYNGLRIDPCDRKDVFWQHNVADLDDSDMVAHQYDCKLSELRRRYASGSYKGKDEGGGMKDEGEDGPAAEGAENRQDAASTLPTSSDAEVMAILGRLKGGSSTAKAEAGQPRDNEGSANGPDEDPTVLTVEASFDFDCFEDGIVRRLHLVLLPETNDCIYAEYRAALAPRAAKNIHLLAINRPKGRAYGRGLSEVYEEMADLADELLNAIMKRNEYNSKPKVVWSPHNTVEGAGKPNLNFWDNETITPNNPQLQPKDITYPIVLPDLDQRTWQLMELFMQLIQLDSGVTNASQGDVSNLPSNSTATGINSMLESSSILHQFILEEIRDGLTEQLSFAIGLIYLKQDEDETYEYLEGEDGADGVMALADARALRHLPMNVDILLTRAKQQEQREAALAGIPMGVQFGSLPPADQLRMRDAFVQLFRSLNFDDPEHFFPSPEELAGSVAALLQQAGWVVVPPGVDAGSAQSPVLSAQNGEEGARAEGVVAPSGPPLPANVVPDGSGQPQQVVA